MEGEGVEDKAAENFQQLPPPPLYTKEVGEMFDKAKLYLDFKRDKDEEVMRLSKDITWESKRIIYVLHRHFVYDNALNEARKRIKSLLNYDKYFFGMAKALEGQDMSLHYRRYTCCVQEYIEALVFLRFLENRKIPTYEEVRDSLVWQVPDSSESVKDKQETEAETKLVPKTKTLRVPLSLTDYILGVCDFTGELMKAAVPTLTKPQWHSFLCQSFALCREIYAQFLGVYAPHREFRKKLNVMRASVMKIEATVYRLKIKILIYGRIPDTQELKMIQHSANKTYDNPERRDSDETRETGAGQRRRNNNDDYQNDRHDSGVE